jgi:hypothetical protein
MSVRTAIPACRTADALSAYVSSNDVAAILQCLVVTSGMTDTGGERVIRLPPSCRGLRR